MRTLFLVLFFVCFGMSGDLMSQNKSVRSSSAKQTFALRGKVIEAETFLPIPKVNIEILGGDYTTTNNAGEFSIRAKVGDELIIKNDDFKTVYYTIKDGQNITVQVEQAEPESAPISSKKFIQRSRNDFADNIDQAKASLKNDAKKSIEFVTMALESTGKQATAVQNRIAFETLGDIYTFWGQPDLAVDNYKRALSSANNLETRIKLAKAFMKNKNYQEAIADYKDLLKSNLSNYQKVEVYEGLGDTYSATGDSKKSIENYRKGLEVAQKHAITPKVTDLNSKIGQAYAQGGEKQEAEEYFGNSLKLAKGENKKRAVEEKNQVADFYNANRDFDKEIQLRSEALEEIESLEDDVVSEPVDEALTPQRQNYKIANAYVAQEKYADAIPFLKKSIEEADKKSDLVVEKDATRKLSEIYRDLGDYGKAAESYERYVEVVDELYIKKEQEISQAARFSREIALKQNRITSLENERSINESRYQLAFENQELIQKNNRVQKWVIGSLILIALLLLFTAYNQYKGVKQQKYANNLLALKSLRTQMNPHFIFNALNSVNSFIASSDERTANKYLSDFSQLMRSVLENSDEDFIPLSKEIELLELYTKLEHFRFKDKFDYTITVDENLQVNEFVIPPMLLQPYVENAVWHGLRYKEERGTLKIHFKQLDSETVEISIVDDGIGRTKSMEFKTDNQKKQKSKGMGNIKKRISILNEMYKDKVDVHVTDGMEDASGTRVELILKKD